MWPWSVVTVHCLDLDGLGMQVAFELFSTCFKSNLPEKTKKYIIDNFNAGHIPLSKTLKTWSQCKTEPLEFQTKLTKVLTSDSWIGIMTGSFLFDAKMLSIIQQQKQRRNGSRLFLGQIVSRTPSHILKHDLSSANHAPNNWLSNPTTARKSVSYATCPWGTQDFTGPGFCRELWVKF